MNAATLRRQHRAARTLHRADADRARLDARITGAAVTLSAALASTDAATVPGYRVTRTADGLHVTPMEPTDARQLALWRAISEDPTR